MKYYKIEVVVGDLAPCGAVQVENLIAERLSDVLYRDDFCFDEVSVYEVTHFD